MIGVVHDDDVDVDEGAGAGAGYVTGIDIGWGAGDEGIGTATTSEALRPVSSGDGLVYGGGRSSYLGSFHSVCAPMPPMMPEYGGGSGKAPTGAFPVMM